MAMAARPRAALGVEKTNIAGVLMRAHAMFDGLGANPALFAAPTVALSDFLNLIEALRDSQQALLATRVRGGGAVRNLDRNALWTAMGALLSYVQTQVDTMNANAAKSAIEAAGLLVAKVGNHQKPTLQAKLTSTPGLVALIANLTLLVGRGSTSKKVTFFWQTSTDGVTWSDAGQTPYAKTTVPGLTLLTMYSFRVRVTVGETAGEWTDAVRLLVH
jgi:hypothetical protein